MINGVPFEQSEYFLYLQVGGLLHRSVPVLRAADDFFKPPMSGLSSLAAVGADKISKLLRKTICVQSYATFEMDNSGLTGIHSLYVCRPHCEVVLELLLRQLLSLCLPVVISD